MPAPLLATLLVEPRVRHPNVATVLQNAVRELPTVRHLWWTDASQLAAAAEVLAAAQLTGVVEVAALPSGASNLPTPAAYSDELKSAATLRALEAAGLGEGAVLVHQTDALLVAGSGPAWHAAATSVDYLGGCTQWKTLTRRACQHLVAGNGGLSLRAVPAWRALLAAATPERTASGRPCPRTWRAAPEDCFFWHGFQETGTGVVAEPTGPQGWVANLRSPPHSETAGPLLGLHRWWQDVEMHQQVLTGRLVPLTEALAVLKGCAVRLSVPVVKAAPAPAAPTPSPQAHKRPRAADAGDAAASAGTQLLRVLEHPVACHVETLPSIMAAFQQDGAPNTATEWTIYLHTPKPGWTRHWRPVLETLGRVVTVPPAPEQVGLWVVDTMLPVKQATLDSRPYAHARFVCHNPLAAGHPVMRDARVFALAPPLPRRIILKTPWGLKAATAARRTATPKSLLVIGSLNAARRDYAACAPLFEALPGLQARFPGVEVRFIGKPSGSLPTLPTSPHIVMRSNIEDFAAFTLEVACHGLAVLPLVHSQPGAPNGKYVQGKLTGAMIHVLGLHLPLIAERHFLEVWRPELPPDLETEAYEDRTQLLDAAVRLLERLWPRDAAPV